MKEMEALYSEFKTLKEEVENSNLAEVGVFRLREYRRRFEDLQKKDHELQSLSKTKDIDIEELRQVLNLGYRMWFQLGETLTPIVTMIDIKMALGHQVASERRNLKSLKEENLKLIKTLTNQYKKFKKTVDAITDPGLKSAFQEKLKVDEETLQRLKELDASYENRINELAQKLRVIALGGMLPEYEEIMRNTTGLTPDEANRISDEMVHEAEEPVPTLVPTEGGIPEVEFEGVDPVIPLAPVPIGGETETEEPVPALPVGGETPEREEPVPALPVGGETPEREEPVPPLPVGGETPEVEEPVPPLPVGGETPEAEEPVPALPVGGETPEAEEPVPPLPVGGETPEAEEPVPPLPVGGETPEAEEPVPPLDEEDDEDLDEDDDETLEPIEEEEEDTPVRATVRQPKARLWQRVHRVLQGVRVFLLTAIAVHTGLIIGNTINNKTQTSNEPEVTEQTETDVPETRPTESTPAETTPAETTPAATTPTEPAPAETTPAATTPTEPAPAETTPAETQSVNEGSVVLSPGESVYDSTTGVEVGYTGAAAQTTPTGTVSQTPRELEHTSDTTVVVTDDDLKPDQTPTETTLPRTGQEVSESEARSNMTAGEEANLDEAIDEVDWEAFFNDGPSR